MRIKSSVQILTDRWRPFLEMLGDWIKGINQQNDRAIVEFQSVGSARGIESTPRKQMDENPGFLPKGYEGRSCQA
jgi:hypothetical protein